MIVDNRLLRFSKRRSCVRGMIAEKSRSVFPERSCSNVQRPAAIRPLAWRARCPWLHERWTPSETPRPWQDRRTLIFSCDQRPAILRMVFVFLGVPSFVNPW